MENSGSIIEKMLELGIGMSMAQQIPEMMKGVLPAAGSSTSSAPPVTANIVRKQFYIVVDQSQAGPFSEEELAKLVENKLLSSETLVWKEGMPAWQPASQVPEVNKLLIMSKLNVK